MISVKRGSVYMYSNPKNPGFDRMALVVSTDSKMWHKICSILFLMESPNMGTVDIDIDGVTWYVHPSYITYTRMDNLVDYITHVPDEVMEDVGHSMAYNLGLTDKNDELLFYKQAYENLLEKVVNNYEA